MDASLSPSLPPTDAASYASFAARRTSRLRRLVSRRFGDDDDNPSTTMPPMKAPALSREDKHLLETQARAEHERRVSGAAVRQKNGASLNDDNDDKEEVGFMGARGGLYDSSSSRQSNGEAGKTSTSSAHENEPAVIALDTQRKQLQGPPMECWKVTQATTRALTKGAAAKAAAAQGFTPAYVANVSAAFDLLGEKLAQVHVLALDLCSSLADRISANWMARGVPNAAKGVRRATAAYAEGNFADTIEHAQTVLRLHVMDSRPSTWRIVERIDSCTVLLPLCAAAHMQLASRQLGSMEAEMHALAAVRCADMLWLVSGPRSIAAPLCERMSKLAQPMAAASRHASGFVKGDDAYRIPTELPEAHPLIRAFETTKGARRVERIAASDLTVEMFRQGAFRDATPLVITGACNTPPPWAKDLGVLVARHGHRVVPVECGRHRVVGGSGVHSRVMRFDEFVHAFIAPKAPARTADAVVCEQYARWLGGTKSSSPPPWYAPRASELGAGQDAGFLAQHAVLEQLGISSDVPIPGYATVGVTTHDAHAWIGGAGSCTPCHWDAHENLHVQLGGYKFVRLFAPSESARLYPEHAAPTDNADDEDGKASTESVDGSQGNFSAVDIMSPDASKRFPAYADATFVDCVLAPGDALYIPWGWWHYCEALTASVSVNFWFDRPHAQLAHIMQSSA
ncbi:hypothetical protein PPROV_000353600 [Pycnococcus provasolii]|uniref:JmjC domain-containing protein n=2 Tax=Pycnococcus provasolii TaxID=41880 RepID=A0A830HE46_9CHLO|nr:hypothetical protein PPROV_000353600 [Pycnococcus provasolii]